MQPTTSTGNTDSTTAILGTLRAALLAYRTASGEGMPSVLNDLWIHRAPNQTVMPYGVLRLFGRQTSGAHNSRRETALFEITLSCRPVTQLPTLERVADWCDEAMTQYVAIAQGLMFSRERQRDTMPFAGPPVDSETGTIRLVYSLTLWPQFLVALHP